ncbi:hypothetical protein EDD96_1567 [Streptomyces sp. Ag109_G2-6]|uniref:hypothetical protein n=1 Tax=Streptomyces TaxID=1883 RepID=UPI0009A5515F|nr:MULTISPECIES: hypothetical protein [Streptomyces]RPF45021.1 hypothetical protein EDD96_1567 [Streptomyces sp. Ag109_G2-6]
MSERAAAAVALSGVARIEAQARRRGRWHAGYLWAFAGWQLALVPAVLLWHGPAGALVCSLANALVVTGLSVFAMRQPVVPRGYARRHLTAVGAWAACYAAALAAGLAVFPDSAGFAAAAALVCALPPAVAARQGTRAA